MNQQDVQWSNLFLYQMIDSGGASTKTINSEEGANGLRYFNEKLQIKSENQWVDIPLDEFHLST